MPTSSTIADEIRTLRMQAEMYRKLAATLFDKRTASELQHYALELEAERAALAESLESQIAASEAAARPVVAAA